MKDFRPEEKTYIIPMPKEDFIRHIERIIQNHKKEKWEFLFPPYLDISNVTLKKDTLIVYNLRDQNRLHQTLAFLEQLKPQLLKTAARPY